jgi:hypothetical protein
VLKDRFPAAVAWGQATSSAGDSVMDGDHESMTDERNGVKSKEDVFHILRICYVSFVLRCVPVLWAIVVSCERLISRCCKPEKV